jgi:sugar lactone lactonase YvrE
MTALGIEAPLWLAQAAWPAMRERRFGRILLTTSDRAIYPEYALTGLAAYAAAKLAAVGIANVLALEGEPFGILVNAVSPVAKTRMWGVDGEPDELRPEDVAPGVVFLVSPECHLSGWVLRASNGQFVATRASEAERVNYPRDLRAVAATSAEEVAARWPRIAIATREARAAAPGRVATALGIAATLGECPVWSARRRRLLWVDTVGRSLNLFDPVTGRNEAWSMPDDIGMVAERPDGALVAGLGCDLAVVRSQGQVERLSTAPGARPGLRLNDGRFDAAGRLWVGLMDEALGEGSGVLYRYDPDGSWHVMRKGYTLVNGLDWSPDGRTLYVTESRRREIYAYDHDPKTGALGARCTFARFGEGEGYPDGLLVEPSTGALWSTLFDGAAIQRFEPDGTRSTRIALPVPRPTSCAFAPDGSSLFVTTARLGLDDEALRQSPSSGALLRVAMEV